MPPRRSAARWGLVGLAAAAVALLVSGGCTPAAPASPGVPTGLGPSSDLGTDTTSDHGAVATGLDEGLAARFAAAQEAAVADGVALTLTSGWRSAQEQQRLVDEAVERYGDTDEAHRWVLPPETSAHVRGLAIDVGLCPTYASEVWHFEKLAEGASVCPEPHPDSSWGW